MSSTERLQDNVHQAFLNILNYELFQIASKRADTVHNFVSIKI